MSIFTVDIRKMYIFINIYPISSNVFTLLSTTYASKLCILEKCPYQSLNIRIDMWIRIKEISAHYELSCHKAGLVHCMYIRLTGLCA